MRMIRYTLLGVTIFLLLTDSIAAGRWYADDQVKRGEKLFSENCASCHGQNAEATQNWKQPGTDGKYPPPPLHGSAHAWHHPMSILRRQIRSGWIPLGGNMPPFKEKMSATEIDDVIAYFQSKWSDRIYMLWEERQAAMGKAKGN
ncbi:c-type cytochrome [Solemya elarraichensis gill symbiont]|uniref:Cytochrome c domain-containing protein n=1 Tax=Solemya elarraichensis gill symbiont TaxID=1918949 RepID=A0A1T2KUM6_9GAMM|nr:cytochrome c [Solemya elarraichensis gill symbiont]OOZ36501.1 hypothetical protein BOW52_10735 [Solemya elarraichensis gill symbiont]